MANAKRDQNNVPTLLAVSAADGSATVPVYANPTTHRLLVDLGAGVTGPGSSTDNNIVLFDGNTGQVIKDSGVNTTTILSTVVPYTGATGDVDLGSNKISTDTVSSSTAATPLRLEGENGITLYDKGLANPALTVTLDPTNVTAARTVSFPDADGTLALESGANGSFTTADAKTVTVVNGIITSIV